MSEKKTLVAATTNEHKITEISSIAGSFGYRVLSRAEAGVPDFEIEETGETFEENAYLKAKTIFDFLGGEVSVVADDSGLEVDALGGAPGVYSARFAELDGPSACTDNRGRQDNANNAKLLGLLADVPAGERSARFVSVIACIMPGRGPIICRGEVEGQIDSTETGTAGFGYDPLFIPAGYEYSFGLFKPEDKNAISHRGRAITLLAKELEAENKRKY
jgi:XTP/dITP diphosphohydrolase